MPLDGDPPEPDEADDLDLTARPSTRLRRDADLLGRKKSPCRDFLKNKIDAIVRGFEDQAERSDALDQWWRIYNCVLDDNQFYHGNAEVYVPIIRDAINARATRFANQLFPQGGRVVDATTPDGSIPYETIASVNHYIEDAKLKTRVVKPLLRNGDVEGHLNLYVDWDEVERHIVSRETHPPTDPQSGMEMPGEEIVDITEEAIVEGAPGFEVLHDSDVLVLPQTADSVEKALARGGSVTLVRRWSKEQYDDMLDAGELKGPSGAEEGGRFVQADMAGLNDVAKSLARAVGVRAKGPHFLAFETWLMLPMGDKGFAKDGERRLCRLWWGIDKEPLGLKRNPNWNDRCPLLSEPVEKVAGVFKGKSQVEALAPLQYEANDAANERADVDHYGSMPIIRRTPGEGNKPLILNLAAVWDAAPGDVEFMQFPDLSQRANARIMAATQIIFQSLGVNPAMLPQQTGRPGAKRNQAETALELQVDLLTTAEAVEVPTALLTDLVGWIVDLDHQFRDGDLTVRAYGEMGLKAEMIDVPPLQNRTRYRFQWVGAQQAKLNAALMQQATGLLNVTKGLMPQLQGEGYKVTLGPIVERMFANALGPDIARLTLVDQRHQQSIEPEMENDWLLDGFQVPVQALDDDQKHLMAHMPVLKMIGDPHGTMGVHVALHMRQMQMKTQAQAIKQAMQQMQAGGMGQGGGAGGGGQGPRPPQQGASPAGPRLIKGPAGMISQDQLPRAGAPVPPRRA